MYILNFDVEESAMTQITQTFYLVEKLCVKMRIEMNIIESESEIIDLLLRKFRLACEVSIKLKITSSILRDDRAILVHMQITMSFYSIINVSIKLRERTELSSRRDYVFHSQITSLNLDFEDDVLTHIVDVNIDMIQVRNATNKSTLLLKSLKLERVLNYIEKECYVANLAHAHLAVELSWKRQTIKIVITVLTAL